MKNWDRTSEEFAAHIKHYCTVTQQPAVVKTRNNQYVTVVWCDTLNQFLSVDSPYTWNSFGWSTVCASLDLYEFHWTPIGEAA